MPIADPAMPSWIHSGWPLSTSMPLAAGVRWNRSAVAPGIYLQGRCQWNVGRWAILQNHQAFKKLSVEDPRTLALAFMEQLATYALRRMITVDDMESIEAMVDAHGDHAYPLRDLIQEFILSDLFARR